jgi:hypothetical protein
MLAMLGTEILARQQPRQGVGDRAVINRRFGRDHGSELGGGGQVIGSGNKKTRLVGRVT